MRLLRLTCAAAALLLFACGGIERRFSGGPPEGPIAVGATAIGGVGSETCRRGERANFCDANQVEILSLASEPAGIFEVTKAESSNGAISFRALAEGQAKIVIVANDGYETKTFQEVLSALAVNDVSVAPVNRLGKPCAEPLLYSTDTTVRVPFELRHDATVLQGSNIYPFEATGVAIAANKIDMRKLALTMPATAGTGALTSRADPAFMLAIRTAARSDVQAIRIGEPSKPITAPYSFYGGSTVSIDLEVDGRAVCESNWIRTIAVSTPEQCTLGDGTTERKAEFKLALAAISIYGVKPGTCTLTVSLDGTAITATKSFPVGM